jgi:predicted aspartyl protease
MGLSELTLAVSHPLHPERSRPVTLLLDSGAVYSVVPRVVLSELGVEPDSVGSSSPGDVTKISRHAGQAAFTCQDKTRVSPVVFGEEGDATLLGVMTLEALGLVLDPLKRELRPMALRP